MEIEIYTDKIENPYYSNSLQYPNVPEQTIFKWFKHHWAEELALAGFHYDRELIVHYDEIKRSYIFEWDEKDNYKESSPYYSCPNCGGFLLKQYSSKGCANPSYWCMFCGSYVNSLSGSESNEI